jgi:hypothetical protein
MQIFIYCKITLHVSGVHHIGYVAGALLLRYYDLYQRLQLQFYVLLMMDAMDTQNMWSDFTVNKYMHAVATK